MPGPAIGFNGRDRAANGRLVISGSPSGENNGSAMNSDDGRIQRIRIPGEEVICYEWCVPGAPAISVDDGPA
jgi:hypothetical protein